MPGRPDLLESIWCQGARCGYLEASSNDYAADSPDHYVSPKGERWTAQEAAQNACGLSVYDFGEMLVWGYGYTYGFSARKRGHALRAEIQDAPLPDMSTNETED